MTQSYQPETGIPYQMPPSLIAELADGPQLPTINLSPDKKWMLQVHTPKLPSIADIALDELRLAGIRINPLTNGSSRAQYFNSFDIRSIQDQKDYPIDGLPSNARVTNIGWAPDSSHFAFTLTHEDGLELWVAQVATRQARKLTDRNLNEAIGGSPYCWMPDSRHLLYKAIPENRPLAPAQSGIPRGPVILENKGQPAPIPNYQDLLKNTFDEALFEYYTRAQLNTINIGTQAKVAIGTVAMITSFSPSPDGEYIFVKQLQRPFSYMVPYYRFPFVALLYDRKGALAQELAHVPLAEHLPKGFSAVRTGARRFLWRSDRAASLYWVEAQDGGDPQTEAAVRDKLFMLEAPFKGRPKAVLDYQLRYGGIIWGKNDAALTSEWWWANRKEITSIWQPDQAKKGKKEIFNRSWEDIYRAPGSFQTRKSPSGHRLLLFSANGKALYLYGKGASPTGNRPFVDQYDLATGQITRLWQSKPPHYEVPKTFINEGAGIILTCRESEDNPPNFFLRNIKTKAFSQATHFEHPYKALIGIQKELIKYKRKDGVELSGKLYLPPGYDRERDGQLPVLMWAYPREFKSADAASQLNESPYRFFQIGWWSPLFWLTCGYAIFDNFGMPIIGEGDAEPNETFIEQLIAGAEAAVSALIERGVADPKRLAVGGHSYGAFMTANLLAHTDLFAAGIARSGAYNRTLTPFGFQLEERSFWEAQETYFHMSPFMHADKIKAPLLLIHGEADNNAGTYPMQSERFYAALKGNGATVRLVMLPHESHAYQSRESIMHMLWEMTNWLDANVKSRE